MTGREHRRTDAADDCGMPPGAEQGRGPESSDAQGQVPGIAARVLMVPIIGYRRFISPLIPPRCRFYPSCSQYALDALRVHGAARGLWLTVGRRKG